jgi:hypothetical protein
VLAAVADMIGFADLRSLAMASVAVEAVNPANGRSLPASSA